MRPTVGVMARAPVAGRCKTRLAAAVGAERAASLCEAMLRDTLAAIERSGEGMRLVVFAAPEDDGPARLRAIAPASWEIVAQSGADLGERLAHALASASARASAPGGAVALVDADSPTAPWDAAMRAVARLEGPRRACLGPCADGGYWLVATTAIERRLFEEIPWSTSRVAELTRARCRELGLALEELPEAYDVDGAPELGKLRAELAARPDLAPASAALLARW